MEPHRRGIFPVGMGMGTKSPEAVAGTQAGNPRPRIPILEDKNSPSPPHTSRCPVPIVGADLTQSRRRPILVSSLRSLLVSHIPHEARRSTPRAVSLVPLVVLHSPSSSPTLDVEACRHPFPLRLRFSPFIVLPLHM
ncbi:hypothetical protein PIB30_017992 [Stylosanthes scabra]|uniref:Uncharacterized protein n=1 Tax=Stylosanthes scabra TaxID=79078 RepID=A0ABU6U6K9_9FABA|nr:hypothetical protein [Stylosanthes scabra]